MFTNRCDCFNCTISASTLDYYFENDPLWRLLRYVDMFDSIATHSRPGIPRLPLQSPHFPANNQWVPDLPRIMPPSPDSNRNQVTRPTPMHPVLSNSDAPQSRPGISRPPLQQPHFPAHNQWVPDLPRIMPLSPESNSSRFTQPTPMYPPNYLETSHDMPLPGPSNIFRQQNRTGTFHTDTGINYQNTSIIDLTVHDGNVPPPRNNTPNPSSTNHMLKMTPPRSYNSTRNQVQDLTSTLNPSIIDLTVHDRNVPPPSTNTPSPSSTTHVLKMKPPRSYHSARNQVQDLTSTLNTDPQRNYPRQRSYPQLRTYPPQRTYSRQRTHNDQHNYPRPPLTPIPTTMPPSSISITSPERPTLHPPSRFTTPLNSPRSNGSAFAPDKK